MLSMGSVTEHHAFFAFVLRSCPQHVMLTSDFIERSIELFAMHAGSPLGMVEEDPQTKQAVLNTIAKGGRSLRTPMPSAAAAANTTTIATVLNKKTGEHAHLDCTSNQTCFAAAALTSCLAG